MSEESEDEHVIRRRLYDCLYRANPAAFHIKILGHAARLPRYDGLCWWFPPTCPCCPLSTVEASLYNFFTVVNHFQALLVLVLPLLILRSQGFLRTIAAFVAMAPIRTHLGAVYGPDDVPTFITANCMYLAFRGLDWFLSGPPTTLGRLGVVGVFVCLIVAVGHALCAIQATFGRTWGSAVMIYSYIGVWVPRLLMYVGRRWFGIRKGVYTLD